MLRATGLTRRHVLDDVTVEARAGEVVGLAGLLGSGPDGDGQGHLRRAAARQRRGRGRRRAGQALDPRGPRSRPGIALIPEDRKADGIIPTLSVRENIVLAALPTISRAGFVSRAPAGRPRRGADAPPADQGVEPRPAGQRAVRRQPAEGPARARPVPRAAGAAPRRSDPRHRRRREGRDPGR